MNTTNTNSAHVEEQTSNAQIECTKHNIHQPNSTQQHPETIEEVDENNQPSVKEEISLQSSEPKSSNKKKVIIGIVVVCLVSLIIGLCVGLIPQQQEEYDDTPLVVERQFLEGEIEEFDYSINTTIDEKTNRVNYTIQYIVTEKLPIKTLFLASIEKNSFQEIEDGKVNVTTFPPINKFEDVLVNEEGQFTEQDPIFSFEIYKNGTVGLIEFPEQMDINLVIPMRSFLLAYSPDMVESSYSPENKTVSQNEIKLTKKEKKEENQMVEETTQQNEFQLNGSFKSSTVVSMLEIGGGQTAGRNLLGFRHARKIIREVSKLLKRYRVGKFIRVSFSVIRKHWKKVCMVIPKCRAVYSIYRVARYIVQQIINQMNKRLLVRQDNQDNQVSLVKYDKNVQILNSTLLSYKIQAYGYIKLNIDLDSHPENKHQTTPTFNVEVGTILQVNGKKEEIPLTKPQIKYSALSLEHTLVLIREEISKLEDEYKGIVDNVQDLIFDGHIDKISPEIINIGAEITSLVNKVQEQETKRNPSTTNGILNDILAVQKELLAKLIGASSQQKTIAALEKHTRQSYSYAFSNFNPNKDQLKFVKSSSSYFFDENAREFKTFKIADTSNKLNGLISSSVSAKYAEELKKQAPIVQYIGKVEQEGKQYQKMIGETQKQNKDDLFDFVEGMIKLLMDGKQQIASKELNPISVRSNSVSNEVTVLKRYLLNSNDVTNKVNTFLWYGYYSPLNTYHFYATFDALINQLANLANGVRGERGDCCHWRRKWYWFGKRCVNRNDAKDAQNVQINRFNEMRSSTQSSFTTMARTARSAMQTIASIIYSKQHVNTKFQKIKNAFSSIRGANLDSILNIIASRKNAAQSIRNQVECGGVGNLDAYISKLGSLYNLVNNFKSKYYYHSSYRYRVLIRDYNPSAYNQIQAYNTITSSTQNFLSTYQQIESKAQNEINSFVGVISSIKPQNVVKSFHQEMNKIKQAYNNLLSSFGEFCRLKDTHNTQLYNLRKQYTSKWEQTIKLPKNHLNNQVQKLQRFLKKGGELFATFNKIDFCQWEASIKTKLGDLPAQLPQFELFVQIYNKFQSSFNEAKSQLKKANEQIAGYPQKLKQQTTQQGIKNFIEEVYGMAQNERKIVDKVGTIVSELKQKSKEIIIFDYGYSSQRQEQRSHFSGTPFTISSTDMFPTIVSLKEKALAAASTINSDLLTAVSNVHSVKKTLENTIKGVDNGMNQLKQQFISALDPFMNAGISSNFDELAKAQQKFDNIFNGIESTVFGNLLSISPSNNFKCEDKELQKLSDSASSSLSELIMVSKMSLKYIKYRAQDYKSRAQKVISKLQISHLQKLRQISAAIQQQDSNMNNQLKTALSPLSSFESDVKADYRELFKFQQSYSSVEDKVKTTVSAISSDIQKKVNEFKNSFPSNCEFYTRFKISSAYPLLNNAPAVFAFNYGEIFSSLRSRVNSIKVKINNLKGKQGDLMNELSFIKNTIKNAKTKAESKLSSIKSEMENLKNKFVFLRNMIFVDPIAEMNVIKASVNKIKGSLQQIVLEDIGSIKTVYEHRLPSELSLFTSIVSSIYGKYNGLLSLLKSSQLSKALAKIQQFNSCSAVTKMQKLKLADIYISRKTNYKAPNENAILYKEKYQNYNVPIMPKYKEAIVTSIGAYTTELSLNYTLNMSTQMAVEKTRNVNIETNFSGSVASQFSMTMNEGTNLQIRLNQESNAVQQTIEPAFHLYNIVPVQLVSQVEDMEEMKKHNDIKVTFTIDLIEQNEALEREGSVMRKRLVEQSCSSSC